MSIETLESRTTPASLQPGFSEVLLAGGLSSPTAMEIAPDGRIFVAEQGGNLRVIKNNQLLTAPFVSLTVDSAGERGLLGVAFDPNFASNHFVYVYYTTTSGGAHNRISRFVANGDVAGSETVLVNLDALSTATNHNGGGIHFGADGKLYVGVGENATSSNSQSLANRLGKILRYNADGTIPSDNPTSFSGVVGSPTGVNRAIWAVGLRNPFTFTVQPGTGRLFINDVGAGAFEEINDGAAGANYGWPAAEGPSSVPTFTNPLFSYGHGGGNTLGFAISGGAFYNSPTNSFPADYQGDYFFADYVNNWIRKYDPASGAVTLFASAIASSPVDLKVDGAGNLLYLTHDGTSGGAVVAIQAISAQQQRQFIAALYRDFLNRTPTAGEIDSWMQPLAALGQKAIANAIARSNEALGRIVDGVYQHILGRAADASGRAAWVGQLAANQTIEQVVASFTATSEFAARATTLVHSGDANADFVRALYQIVLQRPANAVSDAEVSAWVGQVPIQGRANIALQFVAGPEFRSAAITAIYGSATPLPFFTKVLRRSNPPPASEVGAWANTPFDLLTIETLFASSPEYFNNG